jgi:hypothetical protein
MATPGIPTLTPTADEAGDVPTNATVPIKSAPSAPLAI